MSHSVDYDGHEVLLGIENAMHNYNNAIVDKIVLLVEPNMKILDFGAGIGTLATLLRNRGFEAICLEPDAGQRQILNDRNFSNIENLNAIKDGSLDLIYSSNVLEHIADDEGQLRLLAQKLKPNGKLFLYLPAMMTLFSRMDVAIGHHRRYTGRGLNLKLVNAGLMPERTYYADTLGFFATLGLKAMQTKSITFSLPALRFYDRFLFPITSWVERFIKFPIGKNVVSISHR